MKFAMSMEPSMSPGDSSFYKPFILVEEGQSVYKGQIIAYMYLAPDGNFPGPHIHFSVQPNGESQQAPAIFTDQIGQDFHAKWDGINFVMYMNQMSKQYHIAILIHPDRDPKISWISCI